MADIDVGLITPTAAQANDAMIVRRGTDPNESIALVEVDDFATAGQGALADSAVQPGDLAAIATSGSASDLTAGTLPAARFDDTAHGSRAGGTLHANVVAGGTAGFMTGADKTKLDGIASGATAYTDEQAQDAVGGMVDATLVYSDAAPSLGRAALTGAVTAAAGSNATALGSFALAELNAALSDADVATGGGTATGTNTGDQTITLTGDVTGSGTGSFAATIAANAVTNAKLADMATATIKGRTTAGTGDPEDLTGAQATALLDTFTSGAKGLVPASGGGTTNFLRADGTFAAPPGGGGSPGGASGEVQYNNAGAFAGAADVEIEGGQLRLPAIATPTAPASGGVKVFGNNFGAVVPTFIGPDGRARRIQNDLGDCNIYLYYPGGSNLNLVSNRAGSAASGAIAVTNLHNISPRLEVTAAAATNAVVGDRGNTNFLRVGADANGPGGFFFRLLWGPAIGVANATHRGFCGLHPQAAPSDVEPSTLTNIVGMGWDAADANVQIMHNDGSGTATKIDLGASFPVPTADRASVYELQLHSPNSTTQSVSYRVIRYDTATKTIAAEATGTITTDLPAVTQLLAHRVSMSAGGTSSVVGISVFGIVLATEY